MCNFTLIVHVILQYRYYFFYNIEKKRIPKCFIQYTSTNKKNIFDFCSNCIKNPYKNILIKALTAQYSFFVKLRKQRECANISLSTFIKKMFILLDRESELCKIIVTDPYVHRYNNIDIIHLEIKINL